MMLFLFNCSKRWGWLQGGVAGCFTVQIYGRVQIVDSVSRKRNLQNLSSSALLIEDPGLE